MAFTQNDGIPLFFRDEGGHGRPVLMLSHSLGLDHTMWDQQAADWLPHLRIIRFDTRGHGASAVGEGDYSIEQLGRDALAVADAAGIDRFAFCGLSLGGMIGQSLGILAADRLTHLILANTSPRLTDPGVMEVRRQAVLAGGMASVADAVMARFFSPEVLRSAAPVVESVRRTLLATNPTGYAGCCAAIRDMDQTRTLGAIAVPTLVIGGDADVATPWAGHGELLTTSIDGARAVRLAAAHLSNLERPRSFNKAVLDFMLPAPDGSVQAGLPIRRAVLGDAHVDASAAAATDFTRDFQDFITRVAWGTVWARPGLDRRTRRLLVLATTAAMGRWEEFRLHVRTGLAAELEACDLEEVLLQVAVYAGVPAANTGFHIAEEERRNRD